MSLYSNIRYNYLKEYEFLVSSFLVNSLGLTCALLFINQKKMISEKTKMEECMLLHYNN